VKSSIFDCFRLSAALLCRSIRVRFIFSGILPVYLVYFLEDSALTSDRLTSELVKVPRNATIFVKVFS
jgi:hypothetical protein